MAAEASAASTPNALPYVGLVETTVQALRLAYAAHQGIIPRIVRRLNDAERREMIKSGAVFVFSVDESQIRRWTDSRLWSPSRIVGNFLVYREVYERVGTRGARSNSSDDYGSGYSNGQETAHDAVRPDGLLKKTITVTIGPSDLHVVSYYTQNDIKNQTFPRLTSRPDIMNLELDPHVFKFASFRNPPKIENKNGQQIITCEPEDNSSMTAQEPVRQRQHRGSHSMGSGGYESASDRTESPRSARPRFNPAPIIESAIHSGQSVNGTRWRSPSDVTHPASAASSHAPVSPNGWPSPSRTRSNDEFFQQQQQSSSGAIVNSSAPLSSNSSSSSSSPPWNNAPSPSTSWNSGIPPSGPAPNTSRYTYAPNVYPQPSGTYWSQQRQPRLQTAAFPADQTKTDYPVASENGSHYAIDGVDYTSSSPHSATTHDTRQWEQARQHVQLPAISPVAESHFQQNTNGTTRYQRSPEVYY